MSQSPDPQAPAARKPARHIPPFVWILIAVVIVGFIALRLQKGQSLQRQVEAAAAQGSAKAQ